MNPLTSHLLLWVVMPLAAFLSAQCVMGVDRAHTRRRPFLDGAVPFLESCVCGHDRTVHEHYRRGTECAGYECGCRRYEPEILARVKR